MTAEVSSSSAVGTLLNGTYRLERVIAEGGMGVVYEAAHVRLPRRFAVKLLAKPADQATALTTLARFKREAEIASTLAHPHIVEVFDFQVAESGAPYLVMELLEGEDLADRLKRGRIAPAAALRIIMEIAEALDVAHTAGVVHRDLKPANVFLCKRAGRDDFVKVLDFGVSKLIDSATLTQEKAMVGTPLYMSPEQAVGTQELTPESDIFSLGAIAFEMLTGRRAFAASSIPSILYQIVHGATPKLAGRAPGLSSAVDEVFARVLAKKKADRYKRASHFSSDLAQALSRTSQVDALQKLTFDPEDVVAALDPALLDPGLIEPAAPTGVITGADDTEIESSTKEQALATGESAIETAAGKLAARPPSELQDYARQLRRRSRRAPLVVIGVLGLATAATMVLLRASDHPAVTVVPQMARAPLQATVQSAAPPAPPAPPAPTTNAAAPNNLIDVLAAPKDEDVKPPTFDPDPVTKHDAVQFVFHVWPHGAEIFVDDKRVESGKLVLPYQKTGHRVTVRAPGYHTLSITAPSTANRTFELRLDRVVAAPKKPAPRKPAHDAAPVQDL